MKWEEAMEYARNLNANGHQDRGLSSSRKLNLLFNNRAATGGFDATGLYPESWY